MEKISTKLEAEQVLLFQSFFNKFYGLDNIEMKIMKTQAKKLNIATVELLHLCQIYKNKVYYVEKVEFNNENEIDNISLKDLKNYCVLMQGFQEEILFMLCDAKKVKRVYQFIKKHVKIKVVYK